MLNDQEWDRRFIFSKNAEGYPPDMENFFRVTSDKEEN